ncbi:hypothetical protein GIW56_22875 [Pseudomonas gessardii]|uniref:Phage tail protein n=1 Tax=Pseudomonas gessardii TaxID=78544 RepID=A0ABS9FBD8_9PSED|nr:kelch repeat-containing protein [Pseudomonas gessardii]MCF4980754.1 hypothetical protein [Pseudomonas gessardii]MCF4988473.1 hypothetical protein [Pseudomonas gessardii]MCF5097496.1 hypothetical protein [Pseudomonas gessardii]MCF5109677.1 hypothetical protein [Pseudomonas gessardii]
MANFPALKMTAAGRVLQAKAQTGQLLKFTRVGLGDGTLVGSLDALGALVSEKQSLSIRKQVAPGDGTSILNVIATNQGVTQGFYMREVGAYAEDPDTGEEILYSYTNAGAECDFLPAAGGAVVWEGLFDLITIVGNAENVTAVINDFITIALKSEVDELRPYVLPHGGTVGQMVRKASNAEGDYELFDADLDGLDVRFKSVEEPRVAVASQRTFTLQKTVTNGLAVYVAGRRISRDAWTPLSATQLKMNDPLDAGTAVLFVNNEEAGPGESLSVSIEGPTLVYPGSTNTFTLGAYDSFSTYTQSATSGTLTRSGKTLTLVIPSGAVAGTLDLQVTRDNVSVTRRIAVGSAAIEAPQIVSPAANAVGVGFEPDIILSPFKVYPDGYEAQVKTRWQVAFDAAFTQLIYDNESTINLEAINLGAVGVRLDAARQIYTRAKTSTATLDSAWSTTVSFNTASVYIRRPVINNPIDGQLEVGLAGTLTADAFSVYGGTDTHAGSRWQYSLSADFSTVMIDSGWVADSLISYTPTDLMPRKTLLYGRVKFKGAKLGETEWSVVVKFTTTDRLKGIYTALTNGATERLWNSMAGYNGLVYIFGGSNSSGYLSDLWQYNPANSSWLQLASAPAAVAYGAMTVLGGKLYVFGGSYDGNNTTNNVFCYDIALNKWTALAITGTLPGKRYSACLAAIGSKLYMFGGQSLSPSAVYADLWSLDLVTLKWSSLAGDSVARAGATCGVIGGELYVARGSGGGTSNRLSKYNPSTNTWTALPSFPFTNSSAQAGAVVGNQLYTWGGYSAGSYIRDLSVYDPSEGKWTALPAGGYGRSNTAACGLNDKLYMFGGTAGNGGTTQFYSVQ